MSFKHQHIALAASLLCLAGPVSASEPAANPAATDKSAAETMTKAQPVRVRFTGIESDKGKIWISLCTRAEVPKLREGGCTGNAQIPASDGAEHVFNAVPPATYIITAFHDDNDNGRLDFDQQGIPFEAIGNSRNAVGEFGPPTFEQTKFDLRPLNQTSAELFLEIKMRRIELP
ncbi:MAG: DUF2141 domain-containing protein [Pseudomonadota bacterium]